MVGQIDCVKVRKNIKLSPIHHVTTVTTGSSTLPVLLPALLGP